MIFAIIYAAFLNIVIEKWKYPASAVASSYRCLCAISHWYPYAITLNNAHGSVNDFLWKNTLHTVSYKYRLIILNGCIVLCLPVRIVRVPFNFTARNTSATPFRGQPMCFPGCILQCTQKLMQVFPPARSVLPGPGAGRLWR